jgi:membrane-associated phospholipid phosphatase
MKDRRPVRIFKKYIRVWALIYSCIYLLWFFLLEKNITTDYHIIHCSLDDRIPFNEYFIIPYLSWFTYLIPAVLYMSRGDADEFSRYFLYLAAGTSICLFVCTVFPNGTGADFRPVIDPHKNWACALVSLIYRSDTPTNVFPSIHVCTTIGTHIAILRNRRFSEKPWIWKVSLAVAVLIILSTMFLKQHSVLDVISGGLLSVLLYRLFYGNAPAPDEAQAVDK